MLRLITQGELDLREPVEVSGPWRLICFGRKTPSGVDITNREREVASFSTERLVTLLRDQMQTPQSVGNVFPIGFVWLYRNRWITVANSVALAFDEHRDKTMWSAILGNREWRSPATNPQLDHARRILGA